MATKLEDLEVEEVSLVDRPANKHAKVVLTKKGSESSKGNECDRMERDERVGLVKRLTEFLGIEWGDEVSKDDELNKAADGGAENRDPSPDPGGQEANVDKNEKQPTLESLSKRLEEQGEQIQTLTKENSELREQLEKGGQMSAFREKLPKSLQKEFDRMGDKERYAFMSKFSKSDQSDGSDEGPDMAGQLEKLGKALDDQNEKIAKMQETEDIRKAETEFASLDSVVSVPEFAKQVVKLRKAAPEQAEEIVETFKALAEQARVSKLFESAGHNRNVETGGSDTIKKAAEEIRKSNPEMPEHQVLEKAIRENKAAYNEHVVQTHQEG